MILVSRASVPIFIFAITVMGFNEIAKKASSQGEIPLLSDSPNLDLISEKSNSWLAQTPPLLQSTDLSQVSDTETLLLQALEVANSLKDPYDKATLLNDIAIKYFNLGKPDRAREILDQSLEVARTIEDTRNKVTTIGAIALHYAKIGQLTIANELLAEASEMANSVEDKFLQARLLSDLALKYAELGEQSQTETLLSQSQEIIEQASVPVAEFPFQPTPLEGRITLAGEISTDDNRESELSVQLKLDQQWETDSFSFDIDYETNFDNSRSRDRYRTIINTFSVYRHHFDETWSLFTAARFERDIEDGIFYDFTSLVGPALNIFRQGSQRRLDIGVGVGVRYQDALGKPTDSNFPSVGLIVFYNDLFFDFVKFSQRFTFSVPVSDRNNSRLGSTTELSVPLWEKWFFTTQARYIYRGEPALRRPGSEFKLNTGVSYEF